MLSKVKNNLPGSAPLIKFPPNANSYLAHPSFFHWVSLNKDKSFFYYPVNRQTKKTEAPKNSLLKIEYLLQNNLNIPRCVSCLMEVYK